MIVQKIYPKQDCPYCYGDGEVFDIVDYGSTTASIPSFCECVEAQAEEDTEEIELIFKEEISFCLCTDGWAGRREYPVEIVGETPKRYRVKLLSSHPLPGRNKWGNEGDIILVPKTAIKEKK